MSPHILIIEMRLGACLHQLTVSLRRHIGVPVNGAIHEFNLEGTQVLAVADRRQSARLHGLTSDARDDWLRMGRWGGPALGNQRPGDDEENGESPHNC